MVKKSTRYHLYYIFKALVTWSVTHQFIHKGSGCCRKSWVMLESDGVSCCVIYKVVDNLVWSRYRGNSAKILVE
jgi:hypothetical protein